MDSRDLLHVRLLALSHIQFSSLYQRSDRFGKEALQFLPADYALEDDAVSYNWMAQYILEFLNAYLKQGRDSHAVAQAHTRRKRSAETHDCGYLTVSCGQIDPEPGPNREVNFHNLKPAGTQQ
jgi:hypothetical protein